MLEGKPSQTSDAAGRRKVLPLYHRPTSVSQSTGCRRASIVDLADLKTTLETAGGGAAGHSADCSQQNTALQAAGQTA